MARALRRFLAEPGVSARTREWARLLLASREEAFGVVERPAPVPPKG